MRQVDSFSDRSACFWGIAFGQRHFLPEVDVRDVHSGQVAVDASLVVTVGIAALAVLFAGLIVVAWTPQREPPSTTAGKYGAAGHRKI